MMTYKGVCAAPQNNVSVYAPNFYNIVGNKTVTAFYKFKSRFAFSYARMTGKKNSNAVNFYKNAVNGFLRCKNIGKYADKARRKICRIKGCL